MQQTYQLYDQRERTETKPFSSQSVDFWPSLKILNKPSADCTVLILCKARNALCFWVLYLLSLPKPPQSSLWMSITPTVPPAIKLATMKQIWQEREREREGGGEREIESVPLFASNTVDHGGSGNPEYRLDDQVLFLCVFPIPEYYTPCRRVIIFFARIIRESNRNMDWTTSAAGDTLDDL